MIPEFAAAVGYIGNSKEGNEAFGAVADLRIYPYALVDEEVKNNFDLRSDIYWESKLPDH